MNIFLTMPQQQVMATETLQPGAIRAESSWTTGASTDAQPSETKQQVRHHMVHHDAAMFATKNMTEHQDVKMIRKMGSIKNKKPYKIEC